MAKRKKRFVKGLPFSKGTIIAFIICVVQIAIMALAILAGNSGSDVFLRIISALGTICVFASVISIIISVKSLNISESSLFGRIASLLLSALCLLIWIGIYIIGLANIWN